MSLLNEASCFFKRGQLPVPVQAFTGQPDTHLFVSLSCSLRFFFALELKQIQRDIQSPCFLSIVGTPYYVHDLNG